MADYISGLCGIGCHEGDNPKNVNGNPLPTCKGPSSFCHCKCHAMLDEMFQLSERDRVLVDNSTYSPDHGNFVMPTPAELVYAREEKREAVVTVIESPIPDVIPTALVREFAPTPTGRSAKGELEQWVDQVCREWLVERDPEICTPKYISEEIGRTQGINPPSVGAIGAVFDRWNAIEYAICERKPVRFERYTEVGVELGLAGCKERYRRRMKPIR